MEYWTAILLKLYKKEIINKNIYYQTQIIQFKHLLSIHMSHISFDTKQFIIFE